MSLRVLFIGGNGIISSASSARVVERGDELTLLNRATSTARPPVVGARQLVGDAGDPSSIAAAIGDETFDVVANFRSFSPAQVERDLELFEGRCRQYVYISSASAYQKPVAQLPITESTPLRNPYWQYSRDKIASEDLLVAAYRERGFPATIIRPSHTYDATSVPLVGGWTAIDRMRRGKPVVVQGDGTSLWTLTHTRDFAVAFTGLLGNDRAVGDKAHSVIFDNTKVKSLVPEYRAVIPFWRGAHEIVDWHDADASRREVDSELDAAFDRLIDRHGG